ncbi:hypothetical protein F444_03662 [Phytophthora nicotianae P1976]|uniref:Reverse transcriptase n=1 Tax=Phytophthora nicotianae P1976 TaxID=1317066 RepID=A0A081AT90_PHYNI|nr:hypothetical protein F444_03662 [Phytophthora nicotianae P1976]
MKNWRVKQRESRFNRGRLGKRWLYSVLITDIIILLGLILLLIQKMAYVADVDQKDWNEYAERLAFALNTAQDRVRGDMSFYLVHGWDPRSTLEAAIPLGSARRRDREPGRWRYHIQRHYQQAREPVNERLREAIQERANRHNEATRPHKIEVGPQVWLYLDRVKERYARKLAHMWHGPFRVSEVVDLHAVRFEIAWSGYHVLPVVHVSKLKPVRRFPDCRM